MDIVELCEKLFSVDIAVMRISNSGRSVFDLEKSSEGERNLRFRHKMLDYYISYSSRGENIPNEILMEEFFRNIKIPGSFFICEDTDTFTEILNSILRHESLDTVIEKLTDRIFRIPGFKSVGFLFFNETIMSLKCAMFKSKDETGGDNASFRKIYIPLDFKTPLTDILFYNKIQVVSFDTLGLKKLTPYFSGDVAVGNIFSKKGPVGLIMAGVDNASELSISTFNLYVSLAAVAIDLTKTIKMHEFAVEDIKYFKENIVKTNGLAQVGKFAATVAHEIRNPLVSIGGFTSKLDKYIVDEKGLYYLKIVNSEIERLDRIVSDILGFTRQNSLKLEKVDLNKTVLDCLDLLKDKIKDGSIEIKTTIIPDIPLILGDIRKIKQVIINILENAIQAVNVGGNISVGTSMESSRVRVAFEDSGGGFDESLKDKLFEPFFTTKDYGTGLGLSICRQIMLEHNGSIDIKNTNSGAMVALEFPLKELK